MMKDLNKKTTFLYRKLSTHSSVESLAKMIKLYLSLYFQYYQYRRQFDETFSV